MVKEENTNENTDAAWVYNRTTTGQMLDGYSTPFHNTDLTHSFDNACFKSESPYGGREKGNREQVEKGRYLVLQTTV